jgi:hypothetical protein
MSNDNIGARLVALIVKPGLLMEWVKARPLWLVAGLILLLLSALFAALTLHISGPEQMEMMRDSRFGQMMSEEEWQADYEEVLDPTPTKRLTHALTGGIGTWIIVFIYGLLFLLFGKLAGGQASFKQVLGVTYWAMIIPFALGALLRLPLIFAKQSVFGVSIGLAALAPNLEVTSALFQALVAFGDFFVWWGLVVVIIGYQKVNDFPRGKAAVVVIMPWLLITAALYGLGRMFV